MSHAITKTTSHYILTDLTGRHYQSAFSRISYLIIHPTTQSCQYRIAMIFSYNFCQAAFALAAPGKWIRSLLCYHSTFWIFHFWKKDRTL